MPQCFYHVEILIFLRLKLHKTNPALIIILRGNPQSQLNMTRKNNFLLRRVKINNKNQEQQHTG